MSELQQIYYSMYKNVAYGNTGDKKKMGYFMKRVLIYMTALLWMAALWQFILEHKPAAAFTDQTDFPQKTWEQFGEMLEEAGAGELCCVIDLAARSASRTGEEQEQLLLDAARRMGVEKEDILFQREVKSNGTSLFWEAEVSGGTLYAQYLDMQEDYVVLHLEDQSFEKPASIYMDIFQDIAEDYELTGMPCMELTACLPGDFSFVEKNVLSENIFHLLEVQEVDGIRGQDLYTLYGYTNLLAPYIIADQKMINVNLAFTSREEEHETEIHLGIPVIRNNY